MSRTILIIALEGINGSGKSTVIKAIKSTPDYEFVNTIEFPSENLMGVFAKKLLRHEHAETNEFIPLAASLFCLTEMQVFYGFEKEVTRSGSILLSGRSPWSSIVYSCLRSQTYFFELANLITEFFILPDLVIYLDANIFKARERIEDRDKVNFYSQCVADLGTAKELYEALFYRINKDSSKPIEIIQTDNLTIEAVTEQVLAIVDKYYEG